MLARYTFSTMPVTAYGAVRRQCSGGTVRAPDDDFFGKNIQPALDHIESVPPAQGKVQITSRTGSPPSILPEYPTGPEPGGVRFGPDAQRETNLAVRAARVGTWVTCYHPARVGTGKSDPVLSRVEPVAHVSRLLGRVKIARGPVLAGERDVSLSRALRVGDPDLNSTSG